MHSLNTWPSIIIDEQFYLGAKRNVSELKHWRLPLNTGRLFKKEKKQLRRSNQPKNRFSCDPG